MLPVFRIFERLLWIDVDKVSRGLLCHSTLRATVLARSLTLSYVDCGLYLDGWPPRKTMHLTLQIAVNRKVMVRFEKFFSTHLLKSCFLSNKSVKTIYFFCGLVQFSLVQKWTLKKFDSKKLSKNLAKKKSHQKKNSCSKIFNFCRI